MTRGCTRCHQAKSADAFGTRSDNGKLHSWCRECKRAYDRVKLALHRSQAVKNFGQNLGDGVN